jgi:hypothetical protein
MPRDDPPGITVEPERLSTAAKLPPVAPTTVTKTGLEVACTPAESVTLADNEVTAAVAGVHETEYGAAREVPTIVPPARKSTRVTVWPTLAEAVATRVLALPTAIDAPATGEVRATLAEEGATVTLRADEDTTAVFKSTTRALREKVPPVVGTQSKL